MGVTLLGAAGLSHKMLAVPVSGATPAGHIPRPLGQNEAPDADRHVAFKFGDVCFFLLFAFLVLRWGIENCFVLLGP